MNVHVWGSPFVHRWGATDERDRRIAWTFCGLKFCWGELPEAPTSDERCAGCERAGAWRTR